MHKIRPHLSISGALAVLVASLCLPALALGSTLPPGVHVDPGSPAAKEYAIPLSTARGTPSGGSGAGSLFGAGITQGKGGSGKGGGSTQGAGKGGRSTQGAGKGGGSTQGQRGAGDSAHHGITTNTRASSGATTSPARTGSATPASSGTSSSNPVTTGTGNPGTSGTGASSPATNNPGTAAPTPTNSGSTAAGSGVGHANPTSHPASHRATHRPHRHRAGAGVSAPRRHAPSGRHAAAGHAGATGHVSLPAATRRAVAAATPPAAIKVLHPGSGSGVLWMVLVAVGVLLLGGGGGIFLSSGRRRAPDPSLN